MRSLERWSPLSGIAFVGLWIASFVVLSGGVNTGASDDRILAYYADKGNRTKEIVAFFLLLGAAMAFVWFASAIRERISRTDPQASTLATLAYGSGLVASALWSVSAVLWAVVADTVDETHNFVLDPNTYRLIGGLGYMVFISGSTVTLLFVLATSLAARRTSMLPRWLAWTGVAVAALLTMAWTFVPFFVLLGWVLAVSVTLVWRREPRPALAPASV